MREVPWFEYDEADLSTIERAYVDVLAERASSWPIDPVDTAVLAADQASDDPLIVRLSIVDAERNLEVLTLGAHFGGAAVQADKLHNQLFSLPEAATEFTFTASGSPAELAERTADWFEAILARPLVRCEWRHAGETYAVRYEFADSGRGLIESFDDALAPQSVRTRFAAEGVVRGRGRVNRADLAEPDLITRLRTGNPD
jgi:hypothetical protein